MKSALFYNKTYNPCQSHINMSLKGKRVLITGGSGFIGQNLIRRLKEEKAEITNIGRKPIGGINNINSDLTKTDFSFLDNLDFDYVIHLAAFSSPRRSKNEEDTIKLNTESTKSFFNKLLKKEIKKIIFTSSAAVYETSETDIKEESHLSKDPSIYAKSKILAEKYCLEMIKRGAPIICFRLSNTFGPGQQWKEKDTPTLLPQMISQALLKNEITIFNPTPKRDYLYIDDAINAIILALESDYFGILNLGTSVSTRVGILAERISEMLNVPVKYSSMEDKKDSLVLKIDKIKSVLKWHPKTSLEEGLKKTMSFYKETIKNKND